MAQKFKTNSLILGGATLTTVGNNLYINGSQVGAGSGQQSSYNPADNVGDISGYNVGFKKLGVDINNSVNSVIDISGLNFQVSSGYYGFEAFVPFRTNTATCGLTLSVTGPNTLGSTGFWSSEIMLTNAASTDAYQSVVRNTQGANNVHTTASVIAINTTHIAKLQGSWLPNTTGIVQLRFAPEVNGNIATIQKGAWIKWF